ncbi:MAG: hypothetical protein ACP5VS_13200, partial [Desulfomonilaceae bacterium]
MKSFLKLLTTLFLSFFAIAHAADYTFVELDNEIARCNEVLKEISAIPDKHVPRYLLQQARGLA